jgi:Allene oxide cyclase barrel like domain
MTAVSDEAAAPTVDKRAMESGTAFAADTADPGPVDVRGLAMAAARAAGVYQPGRDSVDDAVRACITIDGITEKIEKLVINDAGGHGAGTTIEYSDGYYDQAGEKIATVNGSAVIVAVTPHMWQYHRSKAEFADGTCEISGFLDTGAVMKCMTQVLQVRGTSGRYEGKSGYLSMEVADTSQRPPHYAVCIALC